MTRVRISFSARVRSACASASRLRRFRSFLCTFAFSSMYSRRAGCARGAGVAGRLETAWIGLLIDGYRLPKRRNFFDAERAALPAAHAGAARRGVEHAPGERVELRGDVGVARERQR